MAEFDVVIIGAGLAGLSAADYLLTQEDHAHPKVAILEARDRVGGRTHTFASTAIPNAHIDAGGQFVGPLQTVMLGLIEDFKLELVEQEFSDHTKVEGDEAERLVECANFGFNPLTPEEASEVSVFKLLVDYVVDKMDLEAPWQLAEAQEFDALSVTAYVEKHFQTLGARLEILMFAQTVLACDPVDCSFLFFLFYIAAGGGMTALGDGPLGAQKWKIKGGSQQISQRLLDKCVGSVNDGQCTSMFNFAVTSIEQIESLVEGHLDVHYKITESSSTDYLGEKNPRVITCRKIIAAFSLAVLAQPRTAIDFTPELSAEKVSLSHSMRMGRCVKLVVAYPTEFWEGSFHMATNYGPTADLRDLGLVHNIFKSSLGDTPALVMLITGACADSYLLLSAPARRAAVFQQLARMYNCDLSVTSHPLEYVEKDWCAEVYSSGCFAGILPPGVLTSVQDHLHSPSFGGDIHWASTETATRHYGYMEGALLAGKVAAKGCLRSLHHDSK